MTVTIRSRANTASREPPIVVPRTTHLVTAMRPRVFNAVLDLAVATMESGAAAGADGSSTPPAT